MLQTIQQIVNFIADFGKVTKEEQARRLIVFPGDNFTSLLPVFVNSRYYRNLQNYQEFHTKKEYAVKD